MYSVKLDSDNYFTGSYASVGGIEGGIEVNELPEDMNKALCYKYDNHNVISTIKVPATDETTGEQKIVDGVPLFEDIQETHTILGWVFDEERYNLKVAEGAVDEIRLQRSQAFSVMDKYQLALVYEELTDIQRQELKDYRQNWLIAPETKIIPEKLEWLL